MKIILRAVLVLSLVALGQAAWAEEAPAPDAKSAAEPAATDAAKPAEAKPAEPAKPADAPVAQAQLIEGAPLGNANVGVHIAEKMAYTDQGRFELTLYPGVAQINAKFTEHYGLAMMLEYHLAEHFALQITPVWNYLNQESAFNEELIIKGHQQAQAATAILLQYGGVAGVEVTPLYGKFALYEGTLAHFALVINAGVGVANTRVQLSPNRTTDCGDTGQPDCSASFGDTGFKLIDSVGAGFKVLLGEHFAIRLEVRDIIYTARVDQINGCSYQDLANINNKLDPVNASCDANNSFKNSDDRQLALSLLKQTSSDVINEVSAFIGVSFLF